MIKINTNALNIKNSDGSWTPITLNGAGDNIDIDDITTKLNNKVSVDSFATDDDINNLYEKEGV